MGDAGVSRHILNGIPNLTNFLKANLKLA